MLAEKGIYLSDQPEASMNGTLLRRVLVERFLTVAERQAIPEKPRRPAAAALCEGYAAPGLLSTRGAILDANRGANFNAD